jgi:hypothetical protein
MGRKSSAKGQARQPVAHIQTSDGGSRFKTAVGVTAVVLLLTLIALAYGRNTRPTQEAPSAQDHTEKRSASDAPWSIFGPHNQNSYPPLPTQPFEPPRPADVVRSAYLFAAEHPEILSYVPCFCGCERSGHKGNEDCFVAARDAKGDVTAWEPHGLDCAVCIDVATEARMLFNSGASIRDIRSAVEKRFAGMNGGHTPTPAAPQTTE